HGPGFREIADLAGAQAAARRLPVRAVVARDPDAEPARRVETAIRRENLCDTVGQRAGPRPAEPAVDALQDSVHVVGGAEQRACRTESQADERPAEVRPGGAAVARDIRRPAVAEGEQRVRSGGMEDDDVKGRMPHDALAAGRPGG